MSTIDITQHPEALAIHLSFQSVFEKGLVVYAWIDAADVRIVNIEDIDSQSQSLYSDQQASVTNEQIKHIYIARGSTIEEALKRALIGHIQITEYRRTPSKEPKQLVGSLETTSKLDYWLLRHRGKMRATRDEDGTILCTLVGLKDPANNRFEHVSVTGTGINLRLALHDALRQLEIGTTTAN